MIWNQLLRIWANFHFIQLGILLPPQHTIKNSSIFIAKTANQYSEIIF
jgi:hypothetical protein